MKTKRKRTGGEVPRSLAYIARYRCPVTGTFRMECRCGRENCGTRLCPTTKKSYKNCLCGAATCGGGICPATGSQKPKCKCGHEKCGSALCRSTHCHTLGNNNYDMYCTCCFKNMFPADPRASQIRARTKELRVVHHVLKEHPDLVWTHDKPLYVDFTGGCCPSKRRCDLRALVEATMLVVECDEGQHKGKGYANDAARYDDLFMVHSGRWVFIRFNPVSYRDAAGKRRNPELATRLRRLEAEVVKQIERIRAGEHAAPARMSSYGPSA